jgi:hypothetical protein
MRGSMDLRTTKQIDMNKIDKAKQMAYEKAKSMTGADRLQKIAEMQVMKNAKEVADSMLGTKIDQDGFGHVARSIEINTIGSMIEGVKQAEAEAQELRKVNEMRQQRIINASYLFQEHNRAIEQNRQPVQRLTEVEHRIKFQNRVMAYIALVLVAFAIWFTATHWNLGRFLFTIVVVAPIAAATMPRKARAPRMSDFI